MTTADEKRLIEALRLFSPEQRRELLQVLSDNDETRAERIGEIYRAGWGSIAELLMDIEEDPVTLVTVRSVLRVIG